MRCVAGIDAGGSKCEVLVASDTGEALGWGRCDVRHPASGRGHSGSGRTEESIRTAFRQALRNVACDEMIISSVVHKFPDAFLQSLHTPVPAVARVTEYAAAFTQAGASCGIVAVAGTGAFVYGETRDNRRLYLDGLGPLLGDHGSAYEIGTMGLRAAAQGTWHARHRTSLSEAIPRALKPDGVPERRLKLMVAFMYDYPDRGEIADLARVVFAEARAGDRVAAGILNRAADGLAETLRDVVENLGIGADEYPLIGAGGVIEHGPGYWDRFCAATRSFAPGLRPMRLNAPPAVGIVLHALLKLGAADAASLRASLAGSTASLFARLAAEGETRP